MLTTLFWLLSPKPYSVPFTSASCLTYCAAMASRSEQCASCHGQASAPGRPPDNRSNLPDKWLHVLCRHQFGKPAVPAVHVPSSPPCYEV